MITARVPNNTKKQIGGGSVCARPGSQQCAVITLSISEARPSTKSRSSRIGDTMMYKAWITKAAKQPMALETVDLGPLGAEDVEVAVEHCGLCHSDLSVLNNDWGVSQFPAILGHEVVGQVSAVGPNAKGRR